MHPDKKVGMALGILLVGIVGAFFFRNDTDSTGRNEPRRLSSADALDEQIRQGNQVPYLPDRTDVSQTLDADSTINIAELIEGIPDVSHVVETDPVPIPEPIRIDGTGTLSGIAAPVPAPSGTLHNGVRPEIPAKPEVLSATGEAAEPSTVSAQTIHEVGAGETLSGLASKYLGTHRRYRELFEANRDILTSPDALRVGMKLIIPGRNTKPVPAPAALLSRPPTPELPTVTRPGIPPVEPENGEPLPSPRPKFVRPNSNVPRISGNPSRSLGQQPPPDVPRVEGLDSVLSRRHSASQSARRDNLSDESSGTRSR